MPYRSHIQSGAYVDGETKPGAKGPPLNDGGYVSGRKATNANGPIRERIQMSATETLEELLLPLKTHFQNQEVRFIDINEPGELFVRKCDKNLERYSNKQLTINWGKNLIKHLCIYWGTPFEPEAPKYTLVLPFGGRVHALFGNHCSKGMYITFSAPTSGWAYELPIEKPPHEALNFPEKQYLHHLVDALFHIRAQASNGFNSEMPRRDMLSGMAVDIVFEILWSQGHWAIRNQLGVPTEKIQSWTTDDERLYLIKWLRLFADTSFTFPNALPLQKIAEEGARHLESSRQGNTHRYGQSAKVGKWKGDGARRTAFRQVIEEMNSLIREGITELQARKLAKDATELSEQKFAKEISETLAIYKDNGKPLVL